MCIWHSLVMALVIQDSFQAVFTGHSISITSYTCWNGDVQKILRNIKCFLWLWRKLCMVYNIIPFHAKIWRQFKREHICVYVFNIIRCKYVMLTGKSAYNITKVAVVGICHTCVHHHRYWL